MIPWGAMLRAKFAAILCLAASALSAQNSAGWSAVEALSKGTEVRVKTGNKTVRGRLESVTGDSLSVIRSIWKSVVNRLKTRASAQAVIRQLAEILNAHRLSMGNPQSGVMFTPAGANTWISTSWDKT